MLNALIIVLRQVLLAAGGGLIASGKFSSTDWDTLVGAALILIAALWRYVEAWLAKRKAK